MPEDGIEQKVDEELTAVIANSAPQDYDRRVYGKRERAIRKAKLAHERELDRKAQVLSGILRRMSPREHKRLTRALVAKNRIEVARA